MKNILQLVTERKQHDKKFVNYLLEDFLLRMNFFKQWNRSDAIGIDLAVTARHKNIVQFIPHKTALFILEQFLFKKQQHNDNHMQQQNNLFTQLFMKTVYCFSCLSCFLL
jgi:hypothetical protein